MTELKIVLHNHLYVSQTKTLYCSSGLPMKDAGKQLMAAGWSETGPALKLNEGGSRALTKTYRRYYNLSSLAAESDLSAEERQIFSSLLDRVLKG